jgi:hypothetical protein
MAPEILLNITKFLHPTAMVCLSVTCKTIYLFFSAKEHPKPSLITTVPILTFYGINEVPLFQLLTQYMSPRHWAGYYGMEKFVNMAMYKVVRDQYWALYPQRPFSPDDPSVFIGPGGEAVDVRSVMKEFEKLELVERAHFPADHSTIPLTPQRAKATEHRLRAMCKVKVFPEPQTP